MVAVGRVRNAIAGAWGEGIVIDLPPDMPVASHPTAAWCVLSASLRYGIPPDGMLAVMLVEGGRPGTKRANDNGSHDLGIMQINTVWLNQASPLRGYVDYHGLKNDACVNIHAAAWILASHFARVNDIWKAVGMYHSPYNTKLSSAYIGRVYKRLPEARAILRSGVYEQTLRLLRTTAPTPGQVVQYGPGLTGAIEVSR